MNYSMVFRVLGKMMKIEAALLALPLMVAFIYRESAAVSIAVTMALVLIAGILLSLKKPKTENIYAREGLIIVALSWVLVSLFGCLPFIFSGAIPHFVDAFFETVSGFTTTGSSILTDVEALPKSLIFWRNFTHWVGGMGVLVFMLAVLPMTQDRSMHIVRAEVPGPTVGKLVPKMRSTAMILYGIYAAMTAVQIILMLCGGMSLFDSFCIAFGTAGTGGFAIYNNSIAGYSAYLQWVIAIFMILFGVNFNIYYFILIKRFREIHKNTELRAYLLIVTASIALICINIWNMYGSFWHALRDSSFQVASIISTTGYVTANYDKWPELSRVILLGLMFCGACAGSTAGGIKVSRIVMMIKVIIRNFQKIVRSRSVQVLKLDGRRVEEEVIVGVGAWMMTYAAIFIVSVVAVSVNGMDLETTVSSVTTCINNVGPAFGKVVGAVGNFSSLSAVSKAVLTLDMLIGRLEIYPMLMLFIPAVWRRG
ncbi:MAG: TrkH family potassium uptake protein [Christensenellales bacterium]